MIVGLDPIARSRRQSYDHELQRQHCKKNYIAKRSLGRFKKKYFFTLKTALAYYNVGLVHGQG
jgi:hypothetical protein